MTLNFIVNGKPVTLETEPDRRLLDILREDLHQPDQHLMRSGHMSLYS